MKKAGLGFGTFLAASAALAASPAFAQSSVTLYGAVDDAITYVNNQNGHSNVYLRQGNLYASKFGLQGKEDLGGGTFAIFDLQNGFDLNTGALSSSGLMFNRQAYVGLQNRSLGTFTAGRQYTPYYLFVGPLTGSSWLTGATGAHPGDIDGLDTTVRINNSATYTSPIFYGVQASAMYALGGIAGSTGKGQTWSAALRYSAGPVSLAAAILRMDNTQSTSGFDSASTGSFGKSSLNTGYVSASAVQHIAAAGNYTIGNLVLGASYSNVQYIAGGKSIFHDTAIFNTWAALAVYRFTPAFDVGGGFAYTLASQANGITSAARYQQYSLKESYHLSKRTTLYALQAYQHAGGQTLGANGAGNIVNASPAVGDSQNSTPSSTRSQFVGMAGIALLF
ncbi:porin [Paraburkholderia silvatlantica]|uniref:Porin n=1 Tax=Paraburkholderia silvatlantica TaxID=321895 RepID=A0ABR6FUT7_9BURK|nr:porin [Paraburkholderia silvatlantica]MBB2931148.1 putative porin [Paraburkholderia silvatlantica]PVY28692.1 putative porin [Paraburkholderia silvatlantica]PXW36329.1 putative porin [Paraburkholderia silvatlantica]